MYPLKVQFIKLPLAFILVLRQLFLNILTTSLSWVYRSTISFWETWLEGSERAYKGLLCLNLPQGGRFLKGWNSASGPKKCWSIHLPFKSLNPFIRTFSTTCYRDALSAIQGIVGGAHAHNSTTTSFFSISSRNKKVE